MNAPRCEPTGFGGRRLVRAVLAAAAAAGLAVLAAAPALALGPKPAPAPAPVAAGVAAGPDRIRLLGQSDWVSPGRDLTLNLAISSTDRSGSLQIQAYPRLSTRSGFDEAADGVEGGGPIWSGSLPLRSATSDPSGGIMVRIPVDAAAKGRDLPELSTGTPQSGVYPLRLQLYDAAGAPTGAALSTFLVFDGGNAGFQKLAVSLVVPVGAPPAVGRDGRLVALPSPTVARLAALVSVLGGAPGAPISLAVTPQTAQSLEAAGRAGRSVVTRLAGLVHGADQLLPAPYVQSPIGGLEVAGLGEQADAQLSAGGATLRATLGVGPPTGTWALDGAIGIPALRTLRAAGMDRLVVPARDLSPLPSSLLNTTYGRPAPLVASGGPAVEAVGADPVLSGRLGQHGQPVLAAVQDLAELAMIQLETPSVRRGVAIAVPPSVTTSWLRTFLAGLPGNPFATATTVDGLFSRVFPLAASDGGPVLHLESRGPAGVADAGWLAALEQRAGSLARIVPSEAGLLAGIRRQLLVAEASDVSPQARAGLLGATGRTIRGVERRIQVPRSTSVTLTARAATVPITIQSDPLLRVHVEVRMASSKLAFRPFRPSDGRCTTGPSQLSETCNLSLHSAAVTLRVPVSSRTSGVFVLGVRVTAPGGGTVLAVERVTIRSTAVSFVGLVLIIGAALFLGAWWIHNIRHGRRARRLVPPPSDDPGDDGPGGGGPGDATPTPEPGGLAPEPDLLAGAGLDDAVARFFASPPPSARRQREMSPSDRYAGPNT